MKCISLHTAARCLGLLAAVTAALAQGVSPGRVNYVPIAQASFDSYTYAPSLSLQQWFQAHFAAMVVYPPYFNSRTSWFSNAFAYINLYAIYPGTAEQYAHPEWILHDQYGHWLYIPFNCGGGTCPLYAGDIANPDFRTAWINNAWSIVNAGHYPALYIDDVNTAFRVSDGSGNLVSPVDSNTGKPMTYDAWRNYVASFVEQIRAAFPNTKIMENTIWYAGPPGVQDADPAIQRQIATADTLNLERGIASDSSLTGGTGPYSVHAFFDYVDRVHAAGKGVYLQEYWLDPPGRQYGLASYFMISNGHDSIGDASTMPDSWWTGYDLDLGTPAGPRTYTNGVFERDFSGGKVLLGEPGLASQTVDLGGTFTTLDGSSLSSATIAGWQGMILRKSTPAVRVVNAASLAPGPVSPGEIVTLFGSFSDPAPTILFNDVQSPVTYAGSSQVNAVVPFELDLSNQAQVQIQQGGSSATVPVPVATASPAIFQTTAGSSQGAILNQDYSPNSPSNPAAQGSVISIYGTGFGTLSQLPKDGQVVKALLNTATPVTANIAGVAADVLYAGAAPGLIAGVIQVNIRVPDGLTPGPAVPVSLSIGSFSTQAGVTVSIR